MPLYSSNVLEYLQMIGWVTLPLLVAGLFTWGMLRTARERFGTNLARWFSLICTLPGVCFFLALPFLFRVPPVPDSYLKYDDLPSDPALPIIFFPAFHLAAVALAGGAFLVVALRKGRVRA
jgi:hypothetical protein